MSRPLFATERLTINRPSVTDGAEVVAAVRASRDLHRPWVSGPDSLERWSSYLRRTRRRDHHCFLLRAVADGRPAGIVNLNNVVLGALRSASTGYYALVPHAGAGLMTEGLDAVLHHAFGELGLHRVEANIQPDNSRSIALARRCGFRLEGYSPRYLYMDGAWRDHERWAVTAEERPRSGGGPGRR